MDSLAGSETAYKGFARVNRNKEVGSDGGMVKKERHGSKEPKYQGSRLMKDTLQLSGACWLGELRAYIV